MIEKIFPMQGVTIAEPFGHQQLKGLAQQFVARVGFLPILEEKGTLLHVALDRMDFSERHGWFGI